MFWIIKSGLNFTSTAGFVEQYSDQDIWSMVTFIRATAPSATRPRTSGMRVAGAERGASRDSPGAPGYAQLFGRGWVIKWVNADPTHVASIIAAPGASWLLRARGPLVLSVWAPPC